MRNPICAPCYQALIRNYAALRRFEDAVTKNAQAENLGIEMPFDPSYAQALLWSGAAEAALVGFRRDGVPPAIRLGGSAMALYALGRMGEYEQALAELNELGETQPEWRVRLARVHAFVGDIERAFEILNGVPQLPAQFLSDPEFDLLREHPRYEELLEKTGFWPDDWRDDIEFDYELPE
jgi:tetratricopeptide (TPR) repeat protein